MKTLLSLAACALLLALTGAVLVGVYDVHRDLSDVHTLLASSQKTLVTIDSTLATVSTAVSTADAAATEERANWKATSIEAANTGLALRTLIDRVDRKLVDGTLSHINTQTLPILDAQIKTNGDQLTLTAAKLGATADGLTELTRTIDAKANDPQIPELLGHVNTISGNLEVISANSAAMSGDMKTAVHRLAKPPTKLHTALDVAWTGLKFGSLFIP